MFNPKLLLNVSKSILIRGLWISSPNGEIE